MDNLYLQSIYVYTNYVDRHFSIDIFPSKNIEFKHLLLTGKNGSGKSTILKCIYKELLNLKSGLKSSSVYFKQPKEKAPKSEIQSLIDKMGYKHPKVELSFNIDEEKINDKTENLIVYIPSQRRFNSDKADANKKMSFLDMLQDQQKYITQLNTNNKNVISKRALINNLLNNNKSAFLQIENYQKSKDKILNEDPNPEQKIQSILLNISNFKAQIDNNLNQIEKLNTEVLNFESNFTTNEPNISVSKFFQQFLVQKKREQAYAIADGDQKLANIHTNWFQKFDKLIQNLFETPDIKLRHELKTSSFYFEMGKGRTFGFNQLADGYGSVIFILAEIILQQEAYKDTNGLNEDPAGIVLIDELEAHLHISLQEKILPSLVEIFPKLQFIVCTHSPQILTSVENANIYDLSSHELVTEDLGGISYDVISKEHFGLSSEYSLRATKLLDKAKSLLKKKDLNDNQKKQLKEVYEELNILSPELGYEIYLHLNKATKSVQEV